MPCDGPIHIRRAAVTDAGGISQVYVAGWQAAHLDLVPSEYLTCVQAKARADFWRAELEVEADDRKPWVALVEDRVVGFAIGGISRDDDVDAGTGEVYQVYVDPECQGRRAGSTLLHHVIKDLKEHGFKRADLWIVAENYGARAFAEKLGWVFDGTTRLEECGAAQVEQVRYRLEID